MKALLRTELKRGFGSWSFLTSLIIGNLLSFIYIIRHVIPMYPVQDFESATHLNAYYQWIGMNWSAFETNLLFFLMPILACVPFAYSYTQDLNSGFIKSIYTRTSRRNYLVSKFISTFMTGAVAYLVPLALNFALIALLLPIVTPDIAYGTSSIGLNSMWSSLFYDHTFLYCAVYGLINFFFAGIYAVMGLAAAVFTNRVFIVLVIPFIVNLALETGFELTGQPAMVPFKFLVPGQPVYHIQFSIIALELLLLLFVSSVLFLGGIRKREVY
ncbi:hypothetical protein Q7A53_16960 [Halobacillus rhizosphaerae]|uniref:hypothetical protein n=1 Tax=Halobacillus rhizosphaerae TaxID=3064889 RepID=UPI00398BB6AA